MAQVNKIDSNVTGLAYAKEATLGYLPGENGNAGTPTWYRLNPNSYSDFGGEISTVAPNPINPSRQRRKGVVTDLDASGGFNHNLNFENLTDLMQGVMFADMRALGEEVVTAVDVDGVNPDEYEVASTSGFKVNDLIKGRGFSNSANNSLHLVTAITANVSVEVADGSLVAEASPPSGASIKVVGVQGAVGDIDVDTSGSFAAITSTVLNFTTLGLVPGQWIFLGGDSASHKFSTPANNGFKRIRSVAANRVVIDKSFEPMVTEGNSTSTVRIFFGDVLKNETGSLIKRSSYQVERTLGASDDALPNSLQSEVLIGAVPNEFTLNVPSAELATVDLNFIATDNVQRSSATGPKQTSVKTFRAAAEYNTTSDIGRIRLAAVSDTDEAPTALFAYVTEASITINNNVSPNKAIGTLGAFDVTAGMFQVGGSLTAYFANIASTQAVRNNTNVTLDISFVKDNTAMVWDLPLIALGDGRLNVEVDQPITLPLSTEAASGEDVNSNLNHTLLITYFHYVPNAA